MLGRVVVLAAGGLERFSELLGWFNQPFSSCKTCVNKQKVRVGLSVAEGASDAECWYFFKVAVREYFRGS